MCAKLRSILAHAHARAHTHARATCWPQGPKVGRCFARWRAAALSRAAHRFNTAAHQSVGTIPPALSLNLPFSEESLGALVVRRFPRIKGPPSRM